MFNAIMDDIALGEWRGTTLEVTKRSGFGSFSPMHFGSSHNALKDESVVNDDSNKQFSIAPTNKSIPLSSS